MPSNLVDNSVPGSIAASVAPADVSPEESTVLFADSAELARRDNTPRIANILSEDKNRALTLFSSADRKAAEAALQPDPKNPGKWHFKCLATGKLRAAKPEEVVRQLWIAHLDSAYGYKGKRIALEFPITFGRDTSKRADIVVFDKDRPTVPYIIIEVKAVKLKDGKDQLKSYCHATGAPIGVWSDGGKTSVYHRRNPNYFVELPKLPRYYESIEDVQAEPWTLETLDEKAKSRERHKPLQQLIVEMEDEVLSNAGVDVFEEVFKLIFTKLFDELSHYQQRKGAEVLRFRNVNTESDLKRKMDDLFDEAKKEWSGVFAESDRIKLNGSHLQVCVSYLEEYKLINSNLDVIDEAFEYLIN